MTERVVAFVPCRAGSERVKNKNTRPFAGVAGGLTELKLLQVNAASSIDEIVVSSNDPIVLEIAAEFAKTASKPVRIVVRPEHLGASSTKIADFSVHGCESVGDGIISYHFVTSPFSDEAVIDEMVGQYHRIIASGDYDSLMAVTKVQTFLWDEEGPYNYDGSKDRWPRTQDMAPLYEVNSSGFIVRASLGLELRDRIGRRPFFYECSQLAAFDIDNEDQFRMAETVYQVLHPRP